MEAELISFHEDFVHLNSARNLVLRAKTGCDYLPEGEIRSHPSGDGRKWRRIFPLGRQAVSDCDSFWFVGFFGQKLENVDEKWQKALWEIDDRLLTSLAQYRILWYSSCEVTPGGDWFNFVLMKEENGIDQWRHADGHDCAVRDISPHVYKRVRIHAGRLINGINGQAFHVKRTTFVEYANMKMVNREVKLWNECFNV
ncbi:hypothetical protein CAPTEDRAFT_196307 [Capitella teleta]|uniref:Uncharacterized protein n=1 Tax=Capitella teleta TaxID=283909 RepID=R7T900_CAPTE|nr:hypothetical protein CAPTEDRAFT_196307 [Capitella teleta]|eukprot:ELT87880.1 hypothetical protein CAPTEDRAFT_196307 [Capitella teleta]